MLTVILVLFAAIAVLVGAILVTSTPGKPYPILDEKGKPVPGSFSEKVFVEINGIKQGMFIQSKDVSKPVLLFVHGGRGCPNIG